MKAVDELARLSGQSEGKDKITKPRRKTPQQLADEHWEWIEGIIFTQMKLTMKLFKDGMIHGYKHGHDDIPPRYIVKGDNIKPLR